MIIAVQLAKLMMIKIEKRVLIIHYLIHTHFSYHFFFLFGTKSIDILNYFFFAFIYFLPRKYFSFKKKNINENIM